MSVGSTRSWALPAELESLSEKSYPSLLDEWSLDYVEYLQPDDTSERCLCHQHPIREVCHIINTENGNTAIVGNCCITKINQEKAEPTFSKANKIFKSLRKILRDINTSANQTLIDYAYDKSMITDRARDFYTENRKNSNLTIIQEEWRKTLNEKIIHHVTRPTDRRTLLTSDIGTRTLEESKNFLLTHKKSLADKRLVTMAFDHGFINLSSYNFYTKVLDQHRPRNLSTQQRRWIYITNSHIIKHICKS
jgi:hypothetical protein